MGLCGTLGGYLARRWAANFAAKELRFDGVPLGRFDWTKESIRDGAISSIPMPSHAPHHVSVAAETPSWRIVFTGDATYLQANLRAGVIDGVAPQEAPADARLGKLNVFASERPRLVLPAHDPETTARLAAWNST